MEYNLTQNIPEKYLTASYINSSGSRNYLTIQIKKGTKTNADCRIVGLNLLNGYMRIMIDPDVTLNSLNILKCSAYSLLVRQRGVIVGGFTCQYCEFTGGADFVFNSVNDSGTTAPTGYLTTAEVRGTTNISYNTIYGGALTLNAGQNTRFGLMDPATKAVSGGAINMIGNVCGTNCAINLQQGNPNNDAPDAKGVMVMGNITQSNNICLNGAATVSVNNGYNRGTEASVWGTITQNNNTANSETVNMGANALNVSADLYATLTTNSTAVAAGATYVTLSAANTDAGIAALLADKAAVYAGSTLIADGNWTLSGTRLTLPSGSTVPSAIAAGSTLSVTTGTGGKTLYFSCEDARGVKMLEDVEADKALLASAPTRVFAVGTADTHFFSDIDTAKGISALSAGLTAPLAYNATSTLYCNAPAAGYTASAAFTATTTSAGTNKTWLKGQAAVRASRWYESLPFQNDYTMLSGGGLSGNVKVPKGSNGFYTRDTMYDLFLPVTGTSAASGDITIRNAPYCNIVQSGNTARGTGAVALNVGTGTACHVKPVCFDSLGQTHNHAGNVTFTCGRPMSNRVLMYPFVSTNKLTQTYNTAHGGAVSASINSQCGRQFYCSNDTVTNPVPDIIDDGFNVYTPDISSNTADTNVILTLGNYSVVAQQLTMSYNRAGQAIYISGSNTALDIRGRCDYAVNFVGNYAPNMYLYRLYLKTCPVIKHGVTPITSTSTPILLIERNVGVFYFSTNVAVDGAATKTAANGYLISLVGNMLVRWENSPDINNAANTYKALFNANNKIHFSTASTNGVDRYKLSGFQEILYASALTFTPTQWFATAANNTNVREPDTVMIQNGAFKTW